MKRLLLLWRWGGEDLRVLWFALRHPNRPSWLLPATALLALFALEPANFALSLLGAVDELVILPFLLHTMLSWLPGEMDAGYSRGRFRKPT